MIEILQNLTLNPLPVFGIIPLIAWAGVSLLGLFGIGFVADQVGDTAEQAGDASLKSTVPIVALTAAALVGFYIYTRVKKK